jgi:hypothetical protein
VACAESGIGHAISLSRLSIFCKELLSGWRSTNHRPCRSLSVITVVITAGDYGDTLLNPQFELTRKDPDWLFSIAVDVVAGRDPRPDRRGRSQMPRTHGGRKEKGLSKVSP